MKFRLNFTTVKKLFILTLLLTTTISSFAQFLEKFPKNKLSGSIGLGIPVTFFSVPSSLTGIYIGALRYSVNKTWSVEARLTSNTFFAKTKNGPSPTVTPNYEAKDVVSYRTAMYGFNAMVFYNLHNVFGLNRTPESKFLPYLNAGIGLDIYKPTASYVNGASTGSITFGKPCRDYQFGLGTRYYINSNLDLYGGAEYHFVESYWIDAAAADKKLDQYLNLYAGVSIKFGAKPWDNLIDWEHKNIENPKDPKKNYSNWAVDGTLGFPFMFTPVGHKFTAMIGLGGRYSFNRAMGLQVNYFRGNLSGTGDGNPTSSSGNAAFVSSYKTRINQFTVRAIFNVRNLTAEPLTRTMWNHYALVGAGFIYGNQDVNFGDNTKSVGTKIYNKSGVQSIIVGYEARKYIRHDLDFIAGMDFSFNQSKYFDGAYNKPTLNSHLYPHAGVTYKIGTSKDREHIDWSYGSYNNFKDKTTHIEQVPIIEKPNTQEPPKMDTSMLVSTPPVSEPVPPTPAVIEEPKVAPQVVVEPVVEPTPEIKPVPVPTPITRATPRSRTRTTVPPLAKPNINPAAPNESEPDNELTPPPTRYNVIVACYSVNKLNVAISNKAKLERKGFSPSIYHSSANSRILRMSVISTDDRAEAISVLRRARKEIEPQSWLYLYNKQ